MIKSFADKETEKLWNRKRSRIPADLQKRALKKLTVLNAATSLEVLGAVPGNHLEPLRGDRKGQHSVKINDQYRVCFVWDAVNAYEVEVVDYH